MRCLALVIASASIITGASAGTIVQDAAQACAGFSSIDVQTKGGTINFKNYLLSVETNGNLVIRESGVLLRKVEKFEYADYSSCILELTKVMVGISAPTQKLPVDVLNKVRMGDSGRTSVGYLRGLLGAPNESKKVDDDYRAATFLSDGYRIDVKYSPNENDKIVGFKISLDQEKRAEIVVDGYWGKEYIRPGAVLGLTRMTQLLKDASDCDPDYTGGILVNSDPSFTCVLGHGTHSEGWLRIKVYLGDSNADDDPTYDLFRLKEEYQEGKPAEFSALQRSRVAELEKMVAIAPRDGDHDKIQKVHKRIIQQLSQRMVIGIQVFNDLSLGDVD